MRNRQPTPTVVAGGSGVKYYNLTVKILAGVAVHAATITGARLAIQEKLRGVIQLTGMPEFVVTDTEITGIFDVDWNELDKPPPLEDNTMPPEPRPLPRPGPQSTPPIPDSWPGPSPLPPNPPRVPRPHPRPEARR